MTHTLSISYSAERWIWIDHHFIFYISVIIMVVVSDIGWWAFTADALSGVVERLGNRRHEEDISVLDRVAANGESDTSITNSTDHNRKPIDCS